MSDKDLSNFLKKIEQLNQIAELIKNNPSKKLSLSKCENHDEVIKLTVNNLNKEQYTTFSQCIK